MKEEIGTVVSTLEGPSPTCLDFVVNQGKVHRGQFIELDYAEGTLIALVTDVIKTNRYFERAESVKEFESNGKALFEQFPVGEWEYLLAKTKPLGVFKDKASKRATYPPSPGTKVRLASKETLKRFLNFEKDGLHLGSLEYHDLDVKLNVTKLLQKHLAVLALSGAGKCLDSSAKISLSNGDEVSIGKLVDGRLSQGFLSNDGIEYSRKNDGGLSVVSLDENLQVTPGKITAFMRRRTPSELVELGTRTGKRIILTKEHLVPIFDEGFKWVPAERLENGDFLLTPKQTFTGEEKAIDFFDLWKDSDKVFIDKKEILKKIKQVMQEKGISARDLAERFNIDRDKIHVWLRRSIPLKYFTKICAFLGINLNDIKEDLGLKFKGGKKIPALIPVNCEFARLMAFWLAEGHNATSYISFTNCSREIQQEYQKLMEEIFSEKQKKKAQNEVYFTNKLLSSSLEKIGFTSSAWTKSLPQELLLSKESVVSAFLAAFIDCDGYVSNKKPEIEICLASKKLIEGLERMLARYGIICQKKVKIVKGKKYPRLYIRGAENLKLLNSKLNLSLDYKRDRLTQHANLKANPNLDVCPNLGNQISIIIKLLRMTQPQKVSGINNYLYKRDNPSKESLKKLIKVFESRVVEVKEAINAIYRLEKELPKTDETQALEVVRDTYFNKGFDFNQIADNSGISSTTARRVVRNIPAPTNSTYALAHNALKLCQVEDETYEKIQNLNLNAVAAELKKCCETLGFSTQELSIKAGLYKGALYSYEKNNSSVLYSNLIKFLEALSSYALEMEIKLVEVQEKLNLLKAVAESNLFFDKIVSSKKIKAKSKYVYDLETENHNFVANNILVHNSVFAKTLIEELLERKKEQGRIAVVVLDVHGEYTSFAEPVTEGNYKDYSNKTKLVKAREIKIGVPKLSTTLISSIIPGLSSAQKRDFEKVTSKLRKEMKEGLGPFGLQEVKNEIIKDGEIKEATKQVLVGWLNNLEELRLFAKIDAPNVYDVVKPGTLTIIDLSDIINMKKKQIIVNYFAQKLFLDRRNNKVPPFLLILEEAHQFIPEKAVKEAAISRNIMRTIAREGRKFGASLCLISQRPIQLDTTTLSQCNTQLIMRITNPYDLKHIGESAEGLDSKSLEMLTSLKVGEALLIGEAVNYPVFFKVRKNYSQESKHGLSLEEAAKGFEEKQEKNEKETAEFL